MNLKNVLKTYGLLRTLSDDETALLNTLRAMNDGERELLVESLSPEKLVRKSTTRKLEHCGVCDYTRRAVQHRDTNHKDYHEFHTRTTRPAKSAHASSLQAQIQGRANSGDGKPQLCAWEMDGNVCRGTENDGIHDSTMGYRNYHEFQPSTPAAQAVSAGGE